MELETQFHYTLVHTCKHQEYNLEDLLATHEYLSKQFKLLYKNNNVRQQIVSHKFRNQLKMIVGSIDIFISTIIGQCIMTSII